MLHPPAAAQALCTEGWAAAVAAVQCTAQRCHYDGTSAPLCQTRGRHICAFIIEYAVLEFYNIMLMILRRKVSNINL